MPGTKTNERPGTRAVLRHCHISAYKVRQVLDLVRGQDVDRARGDPGPRRPRGGPVVGKLLASAIANAVHNDGLDAEDLYVSACFADEGAPSSAGAPAPVAGRPASASARRHVTVIVGRMPDDRIARAPGPAGGGGLAASRAGWPAPRRRQARAEEATTARTDAETEPTTEVDELEEFDDEGIDADDRGGRGDRRRRGGRRERRRHR